MKSLRTLLPFSFLLFAIPAVSQNSNTTIYRGDDIVTAPEQLRRVPPPASSLSVEDLEQQADALRIQKAFPDALDYYRAALKKKDSAAIHNKVGICELQMLRHDEAKHDFEKAIKLDKKFAEARNNLGVVFYVKKNYGKAIKHYQEAIKLSDDSASFHSNLGTAYFAKKDFEKAADQYRIALDIDPDIFDRKSARGIAVHIPSASDRAQYSYVIAKLYATRGDAERCLLYLRKAMEDGYPVAKNVYNDKEFSRIRKDPRFVQMMQEKVVAIPN